MSESVAYIAPYFDDELLEVRSGGGHRSPASTKKIEGIASSVRQAGYDVTIISPGMVGRQHAGFYPRIERSLGDIKVVYLSTLVLQFVDVLWACVAVFVELIRLKPDKIIFYNFYFPTALPAYIYRVLFRSRVVVDYEDGHFADPERSRGAKFLHHLLESAGRFLVSGGILAAPALGERLLTENTCVCRGFQLLLSEGERAACDRIIVYSGRLDTVRGIDVFLDAIPLVHYSAKFRISGYGPANDMVDDRVSLLRESGIDVELLGFLPERELEILLSAASILVNPQRSDSHFARYSFPSKLVSYMSSGAVVVSSAVSDVLDIADARLLVYEGDSPQALADVLNQVLADPERYSEYGNNARLWVEQNCTPQAVSRLLREVMARA